MLTGVVIPAVNLPILSQVSPSHSSTPKYRGVNGAHGLPSAEVAARKATSRSNFTADSFFFHTWAPTKRMPSAWPPISRGSVAILGRSA